MGKFCTSCMEFVILNNFPIYRKSKDGRYLFCKPCHSNKQKERYKKLFSGEMKYVEKTEKYCYRCDVTYKISEFYKNKGNHDGLHSCCKRCAKEISALSGKIIRKNNPEKYRLYVNKRRSLKAGLYFDYLLSDWQNTLKYFDYKCCYCRKCPDKFHKDHIIPCDNGGEFVPKNIIPSCKNCNSSKLHRNFKDWYLNNGNYSLENHIRIVNYVMSARDSFEENDYNKKRLIFGIKLKKDKK